MNKNLSHHKINDDTERALLLVISTCFVRRTTNPRSQRGRLQVEKLNLVAAYEPLCFTCPLPQCSGDNNTGLQIVPRQEKTGLYIRATCSRVVN